ncbi:hypothetical protein SULYE_1565 [Sulfurihydrogenibium yellowstonense SS-5]|uniref:Uncharacterized protein n=1 Tax=Sulfurihydrogenibium yellowstonense SS-5 TaxID=432331 RepID=C4FLW1_9AQUI|nr:hypothetical protein SULYE_1565 [Sulfurihydrogenibium yellowstonense SS-5]
MIIKHQRKVDFLLILQLYEESPVFFSKSKNQNMRSFGLQPQDDRKEACKNFGTLLNI